MTISTRELMLKFDADDNVNGRWAFSATAGKPYYIDIINRAGMRDGCLAVMVGSDIDYVIKKGTDLLTGTIY